VARDSQSSVINIPMEFGLEIYIVLSILHIVMMPMMMSTSLDFQLPETVGLFMIGGFIGYAMDFYLIGFLFAAIMHFMFWSHGGD